MVVLCKTLYVFQLNFKVVAGIVTEVEIPEPDYSDSDDDQAADTVDDEEIQSQSQLISAKKLINPCLESKEHKALRRELVFNQKLYVRLQIDDS